ncbi:hypothetical protein [Tistrella sp.]|uniref:hypothetical protein n=1 Tax=Tistrella sp. TaxID=2024861 RepID=UPI0025FE0C7D|nr:hypothetical protein [Tistrella sp.]
MSYVRSLSRERNITRLGRPATAFFYQRLMLASARIRTPVQALGQTTQHTASEN